MYYGFVLTFAGRIDYIMRSMLSPAVCRRFFSYNQPHIFHTFTMLGAGADDINARRVYTAVTEDVGKLGNILLYAVEYTGEQVSKIVRKHLVRVDARLRTQRFHVPPDVRPADRLSAACDEDTT